ncbi:MAG: M1 family aminopeptidase [Saprospiraceae bacterium]
MFSTFLKFELKRLLQAPLPWIFFIVFAIMVFGATVSDSVQIGGSYGNIWKNAPFVVQNFYAVMSLLSILLVTAFMNIASLRDFENNTSQIVFAAPISKPGYYFGHFFGAVIVSILPLLGVSLGVLAGTIANGMFHWMEPERFGPLGLKGHLEAIVLFVIPNILFCGSIVFAISALSRKTTLAYIATLALLVAYIASGALLRDLKNEQIAMLLDPFGIRTFSLLTKYWTVEDKNTMSLPLSGMMLINRLIWIAVGLGILILSYFKFSFTEKAEKLKKVKKESAGEDNFSTGPLSDYPRISPAKGSYALWTQYVTQFKIDTLSIVRSTPFFLLLIIGLFNLLPGLLSADESYGGKTLPVTYHIVDSIRGSFYLFLISIMSYFTGILVWKERNAKVNEIYDTLPTKNWTIWLGKFSAMASVVLILLLTAICAGVIAQVSKGYTNIEWQVYFSELLIEDFFGFLCMIALGLFIQTLVPNMFLGFFILVVFTILNSFIWSALHIDTNMLRFGANTNHIYSDFYGYAPYLKGKIWFNIYWGLFSVLLAVGSMVLWVRGKDSDWKNRFRLGKIEWKGYRTVGLALVILWLGTASFVYYNTQVLNKYNNSKKFEKLQVRYEKEFKRYEKMVQPRVYDLKLNIDIFPEKRAVMVKGDYWIRNNSNNAIDTLFVNEPRNGKFTLYHERLSSIFSDEDLLIEMYKFSPALEPGDSMKLQIALNFEPKGFENQVTFNQVVQNGTFFNNGDFIPVFGYVDQNEITDKNDRKGYGLPEKSRMPALNREDLENRKDTYISNNADLINLETTISTSADQMAVAPGSLTNSWTLGNRNYFTYKMDHPSGNFSAYISARYEVKKRDWNGISLEVYYHKDHAYNVDRMLNSIQKSLEYYTKNFGPYTHKQCRIIEFPRIASFAQCFPGTMPYSEGIGFISDFSDPEAIDMVFYVVAHEMGHQWWAHQECGAKMQGGEMTVETFAQYSALMVMEKEYGRDAMRKFLEYEMDRYLRGRGRETLKELPLSKCENQGYIHYQKGSVVMYYLKEMIGEEKVNTALRAFLDKFKYSGAPYPTSLDAIDEFDKQTPDSLKYILKDLFFDITLYDNKTNSFSTKKLDNGKYEVTIQTESKKYKADELGKESEVPVNDFIEIGAFAKPEKGKKYGKTLYRKMMHITQKDNTYIFICDEEPEKAGIDPFSLLIDRMPKDNLKI